MGLLNQAPQSHQHLKIKSGLAERLVFGAFLILEGFAVHLHSFLNFT